MFDAEEFRRQLREASKCRCGHRMWLMIMDYALCLRCGTWRELPGRTGVSAAREEMERLTPGVRRAVERLIGIASNTPVTPF